MSQPFYFIYNLPLQAWARHEDDEDESSPVTDWRILNYMPRKERCQNLNLSEVLDDLSKEQFCETAALVFENLARLWRALGKGEIDHVYYPDEGMTWSGEAES
jgi:hypothetical protein